MIRFLSSLVLQAIDVDDWPCGEVNSSDGRLRGQSSDNDVSQVAIGFRDIE
jgi:hypothetical protein